MRLFMKLCRTTPVFLAIFFFTITSTDAQRGYAQNPDDSAAVAAKKKPAKRADHAGAFNERKEAYYIFGGADGGALFRDMWKFKDGTWQQEKPRSGSPVPAARARHSMAYHSYSRSILLFGGSNEKGALGDFWRYRNKKWKRLPNGPSPREGAAVVEVTYPESEHGMYLFGGRNGDTYYNDFWRWTGRKWEIWDGTTWRANFANVEPSTSGNPSARAYSFLYAYPGEIIMSGGERGNGEIVVDFHDFVFNEGNFSGGASGWQTPWNSSTIVKDGLPTDVKLIKSPVTANGFRFGGYDGAQPTDDLIRIEISSAKINGIYQRTIRWDYRSDLNPSGEHTPVRRAGHVFIWNREKGESLLFGGWRKGKVLNDTWIFGGNSLWRKIR